MNYKLCYEQTNVYFHSRIIKYKLLFKYHFFVFFVSFSIDELLRRLWMLMKCVPT